MTEVARKEPATSRAKWVFVGFILVAAYIGFTEHRAHLSGLLQYLPFLLVLTCPLMHLFMHGRHGHHRHGNAQDDRQEQR